MLIKVSDPVFQTILFSIIFLCLLLSFARKTQNKEFLGKEVTNQLKGFAILAIIFSHIGYSLSSDHQFLYPLSVLGGAGVNLFLLMSGFGLTISQLKSPLSPLPFYKKRLSKLFIPLWVVLAGLLLADFLILHRIYPILEVVHSYVGFYPRADLWQNLDSPLWYFSVILFYYLIFPLLFIKKVPLLSVILVLLSGIFVLKLPLPINPDTIKLYKLHFLAFPLGMGIALTQKVILRRLVPIQSGLAEGSRFFVRYHVGLRMTILIPSIVVFLYTSIHSAVGYSPQTEQAVSLITTLSAVTIFTLSKVNLELLSVFGIFSYEIFLIHWPILSRFNLFLPFPPFLMVILNLILFILFAKVLQKIIQKKHPSFLNNFYLSGGTSLSLQIGHREKE